jgi:GNAT superfamily N-acetyltransferase
VVLNPAPDYSLFARLGIPELQDLNVLPEYRGRGIGAALVAACEDGARARGATEIGLAVGLGKSYGPAQRLYVRLGYMPDGNGITYDRITVTQGDVRPVDDHLCLMMVKTLNAG